MKNLPSPAYQRGFGKELEHKAIKCVLITICQTPLTRKIWNATLGQNQTQWATLITVHRIVDSIILYIYMYVYI